METLLISLAIIALVLAIIVALGSLYAIYFIVRANADTMKRLVNAVVSENTEEYILLNHEDEKKKADPKPKESDRFVDPEQMTDDDIEKYLETQEG